MALRSTREGRPFARASEAGVSPAPRSRGKARGQNTENLLEFLNQKYVRVFDCKSRLFPSMFFELKR